MSKKSKISIPKKIIMGLMIFLLFLYFNNTSIFTVPVDKPPLLLAHRGLAQTFAMENINNDTCTAKQIDPPQYPYLENTLPSIQAAFDAGADIVEFDVQLTKDKQFAVFHDWTLDCRTNGKGVTRNHTMSELKQLDIGFGYTADNGKTYPFRGKGIGLMPSLNEVLTSFPNRSFLIHIKSNDPKEGVLLAQYLKKLPTKQQLQLTVYGGDQPIDTLKQHHPQLRVMSKAILKRCLLQYVALGWSGYIPSACQNSQLHIPHQIAPFLWGWPYKFQQRMESANTRIVLVKGTESGFSGGFDTPADIKQLPDKFSGIIWTNRIDRIAPIFKRSRSPSPKQPNTTVIRFGFEHNFD